MDSQSTFHNVFYIYNRCQAPRFDENTVTNIIIPREDHRMEFDCDMISMSAVYDFPIKDRVNINTEDKIDISQPKVLIVTPSTVGGLVFSETVKSRDVLFFLLNTNILSEVLYQDFSLRSNPEFLNFNEYYYLYYTYYNEIKCLSFDRTKYFDVSIDLSFFQINSIISEEDEQSMIYLYYKWRKELSKDNIPDIFKGIDRMNVLGSQVSIMRGYLLLLFKGSLWLQTHSPDHVWPFKQIILAAIMNEERDLLFRFMMKKIQPILQQPIVISTIDTLRIMFKESEVISLCSIFPELKLKLQPTFVEPPSPQPTESNFVQDFDTISEAETIPVEDTSVDLNEFQYLNENPPEHMDVDQKTIRQIPTRFKSLRSTNESIRDSLRSQNKNKRNKNRQTFLYQQRIRLSEDSYIDDEIQNQPQLEFNYQEPISTEIVETLNNQEFEPSTTEINENNEPSATEINENNEPSATETVEEFVKEPETVEEFINESNQEPISTETIVNENNQPISTEIIENNHATEAIENDETSSVSAQSYFDDLDLDTIAKIIESTARNDEFLHEVYENPTPPNEQKTSPPPTKTEEPKIQVKVEPPRMSYSVPHYQNVSDQQPQFDFHPQQSQTAPPQFYPNQTYTPQVLQPIIHITNPPQQTQNSEPKEITVNPVINVNPNLNQPNSETNLTKLYEEINLLREAIMKPQEINEEATKAKKQVELDILDREITTPARVDTRENLIEIKHSLEELKNILTRKQQPPLETKIFKRPELEQKVQNFCFQPKRKIPIQPFVSLDASFTKTDIIDKASKDIINEKIITKDPISINSGKIYPLSPYFIASNYLTR